MLYKRTEYFRYTFGKPLEAEFRIFNDQGKESHPGTCKLVDISPSGAKVFAKYDIPLKSELVKLRIKFILNEKPIEVQAEMVWKKPFETGHMYGAEFAEDIVIEQLIVEELKLRRRSEKNGEK